jgi:tetratricopeptide (TPR) repeat protein
VHFVPLLVHLLVLPATPALSVAIAEQTATEDSAGEKSPKVRALYEEGVKSYNLGRYDAAISAFEKAYELSNASSLLFNIAQAYRQKGPGSCGQARRFYQAYLRERPAAPDRALVEKWIEELGPCTQAESAAQKSSLGAANPAPPPPPSPRQIIEPPPARRLPLVLAASGTAVLAGGVVLNRLAASRFEDFQQKCPCARSTWDTWHTLDLVGYGMLAAGGAAAATGIVLWLTEKKARPEEPHAFIVPLQRGVALSVIFP